MVLESLIKYLFCRSLAGDNKERALWCGHLHYHISRAKRTVVYPERTLPDALTKLDSPLKRDHHLSLAMSRIPAGFTRSCLIETIRCRETEHKRA